MNRDLPLEEALSRRRASVRIAAACGISTAAVAQWRRVPKRHLAIVAAIARMSPEELRPDLFAKTEAEAPTDIERVSP